MYIMAHYHHCCQNLILTEPPLRTLDGPQWFISDILKSCGENLMQIWSQDGGKHRYFQKRPMMRTQIRNRILFTVGRSQGYDPRLLKPMKSVSIVQQIASVSMTIFPTLSENAYDVAPPKALFHNTQCTPWCLSGHLMYICLSSSLPVKYTRQ
ncbi:hypothetical protein BDN70DRAFT_668480 [Pholiota conissans]|uniref:Uncharacterized protein n=1 Tax=Pholiota conissans TaxID=109636 RepID=A0A9P6D1H5_9AGAR|nr:hypothetical protein BDN70DRAFT_668480 [Pholiota conissans]